MYSVGYGEQGQLGLGLGAGTGTTSIPEKIELPDETKITCVSASVTHNCKSNVHTCTYCCVESVDPR